MTRILLQYLLPILLPALMFVAWIYSTREHEEAAHETVARIREGPWFWLIVGGVALMAIGLAYIAFEGAAPGSVYHAPRYEDGRIIPGHAE